MAGRTDAARTALRNVEHLHPAHIEAYPTCLGRCRYCRHSIGRWWRNPRCRYCERSLSGC
jgi:hypothetical protein